MNKPPPPDLEVLEELDDEAIVAQQAHAHAPAPRAQVVEEARTIVVSDPADTDAGVTTRLPRLDPSRHDPTLVLRAVRRDQVPYVPPVPPSFPPPPPKAIPTWAIWLVWAILGIIAFGVGGFIAVRANQSAPATPKATARP